MSNYRSTFLLSTLGALAPAAYASDHLDTPTVIADPAADIGDIYAWVSDSRLNLVMDIVSAKFSDRLRYSFHVDSGKRVGATTATTNIDCTFDVANHIDCRAGNDRVRGDASNTAGLPSERRHLRVFAGVRDDPFFNNVRGTRAALDVAGAAMKAGVPRDAAGCPQFDASTVARIADEWRHTEGHAATNLLAGWKTAALVISVDLEVVNRGGSRLGVWATVSHDGETLDRMGRALTGNALLGTFDTADASNRRKEEYNRAPRDGWAAFAPDIAVNLANYDGFDGQCGNQWLAVQNADRTRYDALAKLLADDRLWVNADARECTQYLAAEFDFVGALNRDCGGRTPIYDAVDVFRSLLANGTTAGLNDGVDHDEREPSDSRFPFLAAP
jgi:hypothetical protein